MKTFKDLFEVYDPEVQGRSQIKKMGDGGRMVEERALIERRLNLKSAG